MINDETGHILGVITLLPKHKDAIHASMFMARPIQEEFDKDICVTLKNIVKNISQRYRRISADGRTSNEKVIRFIKWLGFREEGIMRRYGWHGEDFTLFSITREN